MKVAFLALLAGLSFPLVAQDLITPSPIPTPAPTGSIDIEFTEKKDDADDQSGFVPPIEQLFSNPAFASGLASGAEAINRSIESLMDALFYSLLDNELKYDMTEHSWFLSSLQREIFTTPSGAYVVVDRVNLGPQYNREMWNLHDVPVTLGVDGSVEVLQINLRTDGLRIAEQADLPTWRRVVNNWFGLLPLLSSILPPSFNPNELYDPLSQAATPFVFPLSTDTFYDMPVGSIRSYAVNGGATYALDIGGALDVATRRALSNLEGLEENLPYAVFVRGEHRINVFRRDEHIAWIGITKIDRIGHSVSSTLGNTLYVLEGAMSAKIFDWDWVWKGIPTVMFPMQVKTGQAEANVFDQVFEFDLRNPHAVSAYESAVRGDFAEAKEKYLAKTEKDVETGVQFHFTRIQDRDEVDVRNSPNIAVLKKERNRERRAAEMEITDPDGRFYVLEASQRLDEKWLDVLVGEESMSHLDSVEMRVSRVLVDPDDPRSEDQELTADWSSPLRQGFGFYGRPAIYREEEAVHKARVDEMREKHKHRTYIFTAEGDPLQVSFGLNIQDRYLDAEELADYLDLTRLFSDLPMEDLPRIRFRDEGRQTESRQLAFLGDPTESPVKLHVTPTYLGRFGAQGAISISAREWEKILATSVDDKWRAFARVFGKSPEDWGNPDYRQSLAFQGNWLRAFAAFPLKLFNVRFETIDAVREASNAIQAMEDIRTADTPLRKLEHFYRLFDADHPIYLARAILELAEIDNVSRQITFTADPKGSAKAEIKKEFGTINGRTYKAGPPFPSPTRYQTAQKKMAAFYLDRPREVSEKPHISKIQVVTRALPESLRTLEDDEGKPIELDRSKKHAFVKLRVKGTDPIMPAKVYVRVEQAGKIKFGKLELAESVIDLQTVTEETPPDGTLDYEFYLTGPLSPLSNFLFDSSIESGDDLGVTISVSANGSVFSDERFLEFRFDEGRLEEID